MKRSIKNPVLRTAVLLVTAGCAATSLFSAVVSPQEAPAQGQTVTVLAGGGGPQDPSDWNSQD